MTTTVTRLVELSVWDEGYHLTDDLTTYEIRIVKWDIDRDDCTVYAAKVSLNGRVAANAKPFLNHPRAALPAELQAMLESSAKSFTETQAK